LPAYFLVVPPGHTATALNAEMSKPISPDGFLDRENFGWNFL
jgi:hypothetical protein